jgi:hypothetical protein
MTTQFYATFAATLKKTAKAKVPEKPEPQDGN